ncbi:hypothetical protein Rhopal_002444-T1 [Rhodotorula paludigena]|uniref:Shikimate dehydrogenase substrate binding N-terminal domain-containing protein n=1 Tax=Rhodotorula paludigena TaxID=86838 RepID=A0AAV5GGZ5_9BASI|nr:hypothetical protein Rhopal_002444-T1 [Rhodotorula paludigena]
MTSAPFTSEDHPVARADDQRNWVAIYGTPISHSVAPKLFGHIFPRIGLPKHSYTIVDCKSLEVEGNEWAVAKERPDFLGSCLTMPLKVQGMSKVDELTPQARAVGSVNTTFLRRASPLDPGLVHVGTNLDTMGVHNSLLTAFLGAPSPFPPTGPTGRKFAPGKASAIMIGGGGATRAAIYAMNRLGLSPIFMINRDADETQAIMDQFPDYDLRPLETVEQAEAELEKTTSQGITLCAGTGAIPSIEPATEAEKNVYEVAKRVFAWPYNRPIPDASDADYLALPQKPVFLEMAYKPRMTIMRGIAEERGWSTICGVEVVLEGCFEQCKLWTGIDVPFDVREGGRRILREG